MTGSHWKPRSRNGSNHLRAQNGAQDTDEEYEERPFQAETETGQRDAGDVEAVWQSTLVAKTSRISERFCAGCDGIQDIYIIGI